MSREVKVSISFRSPDLDLIRRNIDLGKIRSHEITPIFNEMFRDVQSVIGRLVNNIEYTVENLLHRGNIKINHTQSFTQGGKFYIRCDNVVLLFNSKRIPYQSCLAILRLFCVGELAIVGAIELNIASKSRENESYVDIFSTKLEKKPIAEVDKFFTIKQFDKISRLISNPNYLKILATYLFPFAGLKCEVTIETVLEDKPAQKRRKVIYENERISFHNFFDSTTTPEAFSKVLLQNLVSGIYVSVRTADPRQHCVYFIIDVDMSDYIKARYSEQDVWNLTLSVCEAFLQTLKKLGLPRCSINMSGSRGCHLILRIEPGIVEDFEGRVNVPELYYQNLVPGINNLRKSQKSVMRDKFKFFKTLAQAICIHMVFDNQVKIRIPEAIRKDLSASHKNNLFTLQKEKRNLVQILLDTSSMGAGVFRVFSIHNKTGLVSIPIYDPQRGKFYDYAKDFNTLKQYSSIESVASRLEANNINEFLITPNAIKKSNLERRFSPGGVYPEFLMILRFGVMDVCDRSVGSYNWWRYFYDSKVFYSHLIHETLKFDKAPKQAIQFILNICKFYPQKSAWDKELLDRNLLLKEIKRLLKCYLLSNSISYALLKSKLESLYYFDFFFNMKSDIFEKSISFRELFTDIHKFSNFVGQFRNIIQFNLEIVSRLMTLKNNDTRISNRQKNVLITYSQQLHQIAELSIYYCAVIPKKSRSGDIESKSLIGAIHLVCLLYFCVVNFIEQFFLINRKKIELKYE